MTDTDARRHTQDARTDAKSEAINQHAWFVDAAARLMRPIAALLHDESSTIPIEGRASDHGRDADRLESFARPCLLAALWLRGVDEQRRVGGPAATPDGLDLERVAGWFRRALVLGSDTASPQYWGTLTNYHQHAVEFALLTVALDSAMERLWEPLTTDEKARVADYLGQIRGHGGHRNNHLFFDVLTLEFLGAHGFAEPGDDEAIAFHMRELEHMHRGGGWFIDGGNEAYDHYNAYAFHIYGLLWADRFGDRDPVRAERWQTWATSFVDDYRHLFAASGEPVPIGRSLTYRFNGIGAFAMAAKCRLATVNAGELRELSKRCIGWFLDQPITQSQGCLSVGWSDQFETIAEPYTCAASPYWAAKGLLALLLPVDHVFFTASAAPSPASEPFTRVLRTPGWVARSLDGGEVELINAGGSSSLASLRRFGHWKWGRLTYRTGTGWLTPDGDDDPEDLGLCATPVLRDGSFGRRRSRHNTLPIVLSKHHTACAYQLGSSEDETNTSVRTEMWWRAEWMLLVHHVHARQPTVLTQGSPALGVTDRADLATTDVTTWRDAHHAAAFAQQRGVAIQALHGFATVSADAAEEGAARRHLTCPAHAVCVAKTLPIEGRSVLMALVWGGQDKEHATPWRVTRSDHDGLPLELDHPALGVWVLRSTAM